MKIKLNNIKLIIIGLLALTSLQSCKLFIKPATIVSQKVAPIHNEYTKATIINYTIDGCSWMIRLEDGKLLEPINLKDEFKKENLKVWIQYKHYENFSFCMSGEMVTITAIELRELK